MRPSVGVLLGVWLASTAVSTGAAQAESVERLRSYWNDAHTTIYSDVVYTHDDGSQDCAQEFGGTVDGIGQVKIASFGIPVVDFVPTPTSNGAHLHWSGSCVFLTPNSKGTTQLSMSDVMQAFNASADEWNNVAGTCSYLRFMMEDPAAIDVGKDGKNVLVFRDDRWSPGGSTTETPYTAAATAITTLSFIDDASRGDNGTILDTDIEVNTINFRMAVDCDTQCRTLATGSGTIEDLQNTLTHELGHVTGLSHTCFVPDPRHPTAPLDGNGDPAPLCSLPRLPESVTEATMYPFQSPGEVSKRSLSQDDIDGACAAYPTAMDPVKCTPVDVSSSGGCNVSGGDGGGALVSLAFLAVLFRRRRR